MTMTSRQLETGNTGQQIPVRRAQAVGLNASSVIPVNTMCRYGRRGISATSLARSMCSSSPLAAERRSKSRNARNQESRLLHQAFGAAIEGRTRLEHATRAPLEVVDVVLTTLQLVVQPQDFGDETGPQMKWRFGSRLRAPSRHATPRRTSRSAGVRIGRPTVETFARVATRAREASPDLEG